MKCDKIDRIPRDEANEVQAERSPPESTNMAPISDSIMSLKNLSAWIWESRSQGYEGLELKAAIVSARCFSKRDSVALRDFDTMSPL